MSFHNLSQMAYKSKRAGVAIKGLTGEHIQMQYAKLDPGFVSDHSHPHEQMGQVLDGEVEITIADETRRCAAGDLYAIPANVRHGFKVISAQPAEILDIFSPPKDENRI